MLCNIILKHNYCRLLAIIKKTRPHFLALDLTTNSVSFVPNESSLPVAFIINLDFVTK